VRPGRIAYLLTAFPTVSETFVEGEFRALMARGLPIDLYATRNVREAVAPEERIPDRGLRVNRSAYLLDGEVAAACLRFLLGRPLRTLGSFFRVALGNLPSPRYFFQALALFPKSLVFARRMEKAGTIHVHATWGHYPATSAFVISRLLGIPFSFSAHAGLDVTGDTTFQSVKVRDARFVLTCNQASRQFLCDRNPGSAGRILTVYHGISLATIPPAGSIPKADPPEILSVGRLAPEKGFLDLVRACGLLHRRGVRFRLRILGEGTERSRIAREIARNGIADRSVLEGAIPHPQVLEACARSTVAVLASYRGPEGYLDGISNVLVEAMACGTPVVSTLHPASREFLQEGRLGLLVPQREPEKLAEAVESLLSNPARREELSRLGRHWARTTFDRERNVEAIASLFSSVLEESVRTAGRFRASAQAST